MHLIFVYGTLKRGFRNHRLLASSEFVAVAETAPRYRMYDVGSFPALVEYDDGVSVRGEVFRVNDETLARLDRLEGHPHMYERRNVAVECEVENCWVQAYF